MIPAHSAIDAIDRPLAVLWVIKGLGAGGAERLIVQSARYRDRARVEPAVAYLMPEKSTLAASLEDLGCEPVRCLGARSSWDPFWILRLRKMLQEQKFDVVHIHSPLVAVGARLAVRSLPKRRRPRIVVTEHNVWSSHSRLTRYADRVTEGRSETHLAVSEAVRDSLPRRIRNRTRVIRYGVDAAELRLEGEHRGEQRRLLGVEDDEIVIGTVANLRATKGYPDLLAAAREVVDRVPRARFVAVGRGPLEDELRARQRDLGLGSHFAFLGYRPDAVRVMSAFDVFCLPSHYEGLPIALMEALALGLPVVATKVGGIGELVTDGEDALLVPRGDPTRLAEALVTLALFPTRRTELGAAARARSETLDAPQAVREIEGVYAEVVSR